MAEEPEDKGADKKSKKRRAPAEPSAPMTGALRSAGLASCLTGLILSLLVLGTWIYVQFFSDIDGTGGWQWWHWVVIGVLLIVIPIAVFRAVTLWIMGEGPRFVDIEYSWRAGIEAMSEQGISLKSLPLFIIIGGGSRVIRRNTMAAAATDFRVNGVPDVDAPLHWYVTDHSIYLYLDEACWTNYAARRYRQARRRGGGGANVPGDEPRGGRRASARIISTLVPQDERSASDGDGGGGPAGAVGTLTDMPAPSPGGMGGPSRSRPAAYMGTLSPDQIAPADPLRQPAAASQQEPARQGRRVTTDASSLQLRRLEAVCAKLRRFRQPVCPANGILTLLPFDLLQASRAEIEELERALSADLATMQREFQVRCPVTALVVAMEQERGFCELIRRIGREHASRQRFGQRFDLRRLPSADELERFSTHVCGVFEDWVYTLFKEDKVLSHTSNPALYNLLCKVRRSFHARLSDVLSHGFGCDPNVEDEPMFFSGCYFAATGPQDDRQAFVNGVLIKLREEQGDLEWTAEAHRADARRKFSATLGWITAALLGGLLVTLLVMQQLS